MRYEKKLVKQMREAGVGHAFTRKEIKIVCGRVQKLASDTNEFTIFMNNGSNEFQQRFCPEELGDDCAWKQAMFRGAREWCDANEETRGPYRVPEELGLRTIYDHKWMDDCEAWLDEQDEGVCTDAIVVKLAGIDSIPESQFTFTKVQVAYHYFYTQRMPDKDFREFCPENGCYNDQVTGGFRMNPVHDYGCWCNLDDRMMIGRGQPVDRYDEICKAYQLCVRCAKKDGDNDGYDCSPKTHDFKADLSVVPSNCNVNFNSDGSVDRCGLNMCRCYTDIVTKLGPLLWKGPASNFPGYDMAYHHTNFDFDAQCPRTGDGNGRSECCGDYPKRAPTHQGCCADKLVFNASSNKCCDADPANPFLVEVGESC